MERRRLELRVEHSTRVPSPATHRRHRRARPHRPTLPRPKPQERPRPLHLFGGSPKRALGSSAPPGVPGPTASPSGAPTSWKARGKPSSCRSSMPRSHAFSPAPMSRSARSSSWSRQACARAIASKSWASFNPICIGHGTRPCKCSHIFPRILVTKSAIAAIPTMSHLPPQPTPL